MAEVGKMDFPSNSISKDTPATQRERQTKIESVVKTGVVKRKRSTGKAIAEAFIAEDTSSIKSYILMDVVIPAIKDMIVDATKSSVERLFYGGRRRSNGKIERTSYRNYSHASYERDRDRDRYNRPRPRTIRDFDDIVLEDRGEAEIVLDRMNDLIDQYDVVTVADLYDLVGITGDYTDNRWGWTSLERVAIRRVRDGYLIDLPRPKSVDR